MLDILQVGPFMIRMDWVVLALSGTAGYALMHWKWKRSGVHDQPVFEPLMNALLIMIYVWEIGPILVLPSLLLENPLLWLMLPGNTFGLWIGLVIAAVYLFRSCKKIGAPWRSIDCSFHSLYCSGGTTAV